MVKLNQVYGLESPVQNTYPMPIIANRIPTLGDKGYALGQMWIVKDIGRVYMLTIVANGEASWIQIGAGPTDFGEGSLTNGITTVSAPGVFSSDLVMVTREDPDNSTALGELVVQVEIDSFNVISRDPTDPNTTEAGDQSNFSWVVLSRILT